MKSQTSSKRTPHVVHHKSLASQLTWVSILMVTLALAAVGTGLILIAHGTQRENAFRLQQQSAEQVSQLVSGYISRAVNLLLYFVESAHLTSQTPEEQRNALETLLLSSLPLYSQLSLLDGEGQEQNKISRFHTYLPEELSDLSTHPAFMSAIRGERHLGPVTFLENTGLLSVAIALPVKTPTARIVGVMIAEVDFSHLWQEVARIEMGHRGYAYLVDMEGRFVAYQKPADVLKRYGEDMRRMPPVAEFLSRKQKGKGQVRAYEGLIDERVIGVYTSIPNTNWAVLVEQPEREAFASILKMQRYLLGLTILCIILAGGLGFLVSRRLIAPIRLLTDAAQRFGTGELDTVFPSIPRQDEVGILSHALTRMQEELRRLYAGLQQKVTELEGMQEALRVSEETYRNIFNNAQVGIFRMGILDGRVLECNARFAQMYGYESPEVCKKDFLLSDRVISQKTLEPHMLVLREAGEINDVEICCLRNEGNEVWVRFSARAYPAKGFLEGVAYDITRTKEAEENLRKSEERLRAIFEASPDPIVVHDIEGHTLFVNPAFTEVFGWKLEEIGDSILPFIPDSQKPAAHEMMAHLCSNREPIRIETRGLTKDGQMIEVLLGTATIWGEAGEPTGMVVHLSDVTDKKRFEEQFQAAQRMESLGTLAGGIAHDFNNLLMGIQGRASLLLLQKDAYHVDVEHLKGIEEYVRSAANLTKQLLGFARAGKYEVKPTDVNALIQRSSSLFGRTKKEIAIHTRFQEGVWAIEADQGQMEQILMNLYVNAWQAMPGGGDLYLATENVVLDEAFVKPFRGSPGPHVKISIADTGVGMDKTIQARIFDPFFTTKDLGGGTGLGLASAYGIIKNHGGFITVYSEKGQGASFHIYLPATKHPIPVKESECNDQVRHGKETILLVDDEEMIMEVGRELLHALGYKILTAKGGKEALALYEQKGHSIDGVILDLIMPGMSGAETYQLLKERNPQIKVLLSSGYSIDGQASELLRQGCQGFIQKPFDLLQLSQKIREVLEG